MVQPGTRRLLRTFATHIWRFKDFALGGARHPGRAPGGGGHRVRGRPGHAVRAPAHRPARQPARDRRVGAGDAQVGGGHAGVRAAVAGARAGVKPLALGAVCPTMPRCGRLVHYLGLVVVLT